MRKNRPLLSIGMIVKNEMRCLKKCLDALTPLRETVPCELVIADTGSTDGTRELAAQYADILFDYTWCNDFSAARNAVLDRCSGIWHLQVDADELLDRDFSELVAFFNSKNALKWDLVFIEIRNYGNGEICENNYSSFFPLRLIRIDSGARYYGAIHEAPAVPNKETFSAGRLEKVTLHHDGYANERSLIKQQRNFPLLEKELNKDPDNLQRAIQCLEGAYTEAQNQKYADVVVHMAETKSADDDLALRFLCQWAYYAATRTVAFNISSIPEWTKRAKEIYPDSILIGVGSSYCCALYHVKKSDYESALRELEDYFAALKRYDSNQYDKRELHFAPLIESDLQARQNAEFLRITCLLHLEKWDELAIAMREVSLDNLGDTSRVVTIQSTYLNGILKLYQNYHPEAEHLLRRMLDSHAGEDRREERESFLKLCREAFVEKEKTEEDALPSLKREDWRLFLSLGDSCDLGRYALLMDAPYKVRAEAAIDAIEALENTPPQAIQHLFFLGAQPPERFYRMKAEDIAALAAGVSALMIDDPGEAMETLGIYSGGDPGRTLWSYHSANELAGRVDWKKKGSVSLFDFYCNRAEEYISIFCPEDLRKDEHIYALPTLARFAWYCTQARAALEKGDELACTRRLREALATCPGMKDMISYLAEHMNTLRLRAQTPPEMLMLAERVRVLLAKYPEDDPVLIALKNSEEYQLVAPLIEAE